ncbi:MAG: response regulator transcription factor [Solirubrobacterales bacterium]|nr:response regulator transcription factor [Solirubrobacterales bacterium]MBV9167627.1 response regulator transcription factor [Solirubrobacterales bacterium]
MNSGRLTILAVDDEQTQLEDLARLLRGFPSVEDVECADGGQDALVKASGQRFDAIFLDVRMPDLDGLKLARVLKRFSNPPQLVFVSAYDTAAVDAFELRAVDYLRKPVSRRRVEESLERVAAAREQGPGGNREVGGGARGASEEEMVAALNSRYGSIRLVSRSEIFYAQAHGDFVRIVTGEGRYLLRATLAEIEQRWAPFGFVRVHRGFVANLKQAVELRPLLGGTAELVLPGEQTVPVARRHVAALRERLGV